MYIRLRECRQHFLSAVGRLFPVSSWQRCANHFMQAAFVAYTHISLSACADALLHGTNCAQHRTIEMSCCRLVALPTSVVNEHFVCSLSRKLQVRATTLLTHRQFSLIQGWSSCSWLHMRPRNGAPRLPRHAPHSRPDTPDATTARNAIEVPVPESSAVQQQFTEFYVSYYAFALLVPMRL